MGKWASGQPAKHAELFLCLSACKVLLVCRVGKNPWAIFFFFFLDMQWYGVMPNNVLFLMLQMNSQNQFATDTSCTNN